MVTVHRLDRSRGVSWGDSLARHEERLGALAKKDLLALIDVAKLGLRDADDGRLAVIAFVKVGPEPLLPLSVEVDVPVHDDDVGLSVELVERRADTRELSAPKSYRNVGCDILNDARRLGRRDRVTPIAEVHASDGCGVVIVLGVEGGDHVRRPLLRGRSVILKDRTLISQTYAMERSVITS